MFGTLDLKKVSRAARASVVYLSTDTIRTIIWRWRSSYLTFNLWISTFCKHRYSPTLRQ